MYIQNISYPPKQHLVSLLETWFAYTVSLTPCTSLADFTRHNPELCILTHVHGIVEKEVGNIWVTQPREKKRAPILISILLGLGIAGSTVPGTTALRVGDQNYQILSKDIDCDLGALEQNVHQLEESLNSLAKMVLQNQ